MRPNTCLPYAISLLMAAWASSATAQQAPPAAADGATPNNQTPSTLGEEPDEVVVFGRNLELLGTAEAASEGTVGGADLLVRPMLRVAELLEAVPGMVAVQHSGSGKANQYFLRGFNLDHGTDFTAYVDGVPLNLRSHGHGQGYLDVNGTDAGNRRAHRLSQGHISRRRRRFRDGGRVIHHHDREAR